MKQIAANLSHAATNLHVGIPAIAGASMAIAIIVWPQYAAKLAAIQAVLYAYGFVAAANTPSNKLILPPSQ